MEVLGKGIVAAACIGAITAFRIYGLEGYGWFVLLLVLVFFS